MKFITNTRLCISLSLICLSLQVYAQAQKQTSQGYNPWNSSNTRNPQLSAEDFSKKLAGWDACGAIDAVEHTRDACSSINQFVVFHTAYGDLNVAVGEMKYFRLRNSSGDERSGSIYWNCGNSGERSHIDGAVLMKVYRHTTGAFDLWKIGIIPENVCPS